MRLMIDGINIFNPLEGKMDKIIEVMVDFYGEKYRETIQNNLSKTEFFFVPVNEFGELSDTITSFYNKKRENLRKEFYSLYSKDKKKINSFVDKDVKTIFELNEYFINNDIERIDVYGLKKICGILNINLDKLEDIDRKMNSVEYEVEMMKQILNNPINKQKMQSFFDAFHKDYQTTYKSKFDAIDAEEQNALKEVEQVDAQISSINEDYKEKEKNLALKVISSFNLDVNYMHVWQDSLARIFIELIDKCYMQECNIDFISSYRQREYVESFQKLGFNCGVDFEDYINNEKIKNAIFPKSFQEEYLKIKYDKINSNPFFADVVKRINELDLEQGSLNAVQSIYNYMNKIKTAGAFIQLPRTKNGEMKPIFVHSLGIEGCDHNIIHELNHIIESSIGTENENTFTSKCGFDIGQEEKLQKNYDGTNISIKTKSREKRERRKYEALNEIINDYFAEKILVETHNKGINICAGEQKNYSDTSYSYGFPLLQSFIEENKEMLVEARMSNDENALIKMLGKENAEKLAEICEEHLKISNNMINPNDYIEEIKKVAQKNNCSILEAGLLNVEWSAGARQYVKNFSEMDKISKDIKNIRQNELQNTIN